MEREEQSTEEIKEGKESRRRMNGMSLRLKRGATRTVKGK